MFKHLLTVGIFIFLSSKAFGQKETPYYTPPNDPAKYNKAITTPISKPDYALLKKPLLSKITLSNTNTVNEVNFSYNSDDQLERVEFFCKRNNEKRVEHLFYDEQKRIFMIVRESFDYPDFKKKTTFSIIYYDNNSRIMSIAGYNTMNQKVISTKYVYEGDDVIRTTTDYRESPPKEKPADRVIRTAGIKNILQYQSGIVTQINLNFLHERDPSSYLPEVYNEVYSYGNKFFWYAMDGNYNVAREFKTLGDGGVPGNTLVNDYSTNENGLINYIRVGLADGSNSTSFKYEYLNR